MVNNKKICKVAIWTISLMLHIIVVKTSVVHDDAPVVIPPAMISDKHLANRIDNNMNLIVFNYY